MKEKAEENLKASRLLIQEHLPDSAISRLYYALYQGAVHAMQHHAKKRPRDLSSYDDWKHQVIANNATLLRGQRSGKVMYKMALDLRVQADYKSVPVNINQVKPLLAQIEAFVKSVYA